MSNYFSAIDPTVLAKMTADQIGKVAAGALSKFDATVTKTMSYEQVVALLSATPAPAPQTTSAPAASGDMPSIPDEPTGGFGIQRFPEGCYDVSFHRAEYAKGRDPNLPAVMLFTVEAKIEKVHTMGASREPSDPFDKNPPPPATEGEIRRWSSILDETTTKGKAGRERAAQLRVALASARGTSVSTADFTTPANPLVGIKFRVTVARSQAKNKYFMYNPTFTAIPKG